MDRHLHTKYVPSCPRNIPLVDQYMWDTKDTNTYLCRNGVSHPIYDCKGWINFSLPLEMYPRIGEVHPQIAMTNNLHLHQRKQKEGYHTHLATHMVPGYSLPDPYRHPPSCGGLY